jgi:glutamate 5-kinase
MSPLLRRLRADGPRSAVTRAARVVVKIGSSSVAAPDAVGRLARDVVALRVAGKSVVLVSSGAIAHGFKKLGYKSRPKEIAKLQASAAAGQSHLMHAYETAFGRESVPVAQVLLTHADLADRTRQSNARAALGELLAAGAVPILNENDSVAVEEIKLGDNDQLAALVVPLVDASLLVLLSDVDGLLDKKGRVVSVVTDAGEASSLVDPKRGSSAGGMASKVEAARRATLAGAHAVIANAREADVLYKIASGEDVGTLFVPSGQRLNARRYWIAFTLRPRGDVVVDRGAAEAVRSKNKSVLTVGILGVRGDFRAGDAVRVLGPEGVEVGRGLARYDANDTARIAGKRVDDAVVVHRDELVVW